MILETMKIKEINEKDPRLRREWEKGIRNNRKIKRIVLKKQRKRGMERKRTCKKDGSRKQLLNAAERFNTRKIKNYSQVWDSAPPLAYFLLLRATRWIWVIICEIAMLVKGVIGSGEGRGLGGSRHGLWGSVRWLSVESRLESWSPKNSVWEMWACM